MALKQEQQLPSKLDPYWNDLSAFILDCFVWKDDEAPAAYQLDMANALCADYRLAVWGPHGLGKSAWASWTILWFALTRDMAGVDWKVITTASVWRQLKVYLWPEVHKWALRLDWDKIGRRPFTANELMKLQLTLTHGEATAVASTNAAYIEGAHATQLLYLFDEAKAIPPPTFDAAEGALSTGNVTERSRAYAAVMSTPGSAAGRLFDIARRKPGYDDWHVRHVTRHEVVAAGRMDPEWATNRLLQWGEESAVYQNRVEGEFASAEENGLVPLSWVEAANERWYEKVEQLAGAKPAKRDLESVGVDVAYSLAGEGDKSVIADKYAGMFLYELQEITVKDTIVVASHAITKLRGSLGMGVVDITGWGAGTYDHMRSRVLPNGWTVIPYVAAGKSYRFDRSGEIRFANKRTEVLWNLRELLDPAYDPEMALPPDDDLTGELTTMVVKAPDGDARYHAMPTEKFKEKYGRSPDKLTAAALAFSEEVPDQVRVDAPDVQMKRRRRGHVLPANAPGSVFSLRGTSSAVLYGDSEELYW